MSQPSSPSTNGFEFGVGIEDTFVPQSRPGLRPLDEYELTGHYRNWQEDLKLVASTGARTIRYGLPWYRLEPEPGRYDFSWADAVIDSLLGHGFDVTVDLVHYGTPRWLEGSFDADDYPARVAAYAATLAERFGDRITSWTPLNEPHITALQCGERGIWPPYLSHGQGYFRVLTQALRGAALAQGAVAAAIPNARFVHCEASLAYESDGSAVADAERDRLRQRRFVGLDLLVGSVDADHPMLGELRRGGISDDVLAWFAQNPSSIDLLGVNYYPTFGTIRLADGGEGHVTTEAVDRWTAGLEGVLRDYAARYGVPVTVSETSMNGPVTERRRWLDDSVALVLGLHAQGLPVVGYTWWPVIDMIEWEYRESGAQAHQHIATMGLIDLVPRGDDGFDRRPNELLPHFRTLIGGDR